MSTRRIYPPTSHSSCDNSHLPEGLHLLLDSGHHPGRARLPTAWPKHMTRRQIRGWRRHKLNYLLPSRVTRKRLRARAEDQRGNG